MTAYPGDSRPSRLGKPPERGGGVTAMCSVPLSAPPGPPPSTMNWSRPSRASGSPNQSCPPRGTEHTPPQTMLASEAGPTGAGFPVTEKRGEHRPLHGGRNVGRRGGPSPIPACKGSIRGVGGLALTQRDPLPGGRNGCPIRGPGTLPHAPRGLVSWSELGTQPMWVDSRHGALAIVSPMHCCL